MNARSDIAALRAAVYDNAADKLRELMADNPGLLECHLPCSHHTPLSMAASEGHVETVIRLLELGATPNPTEDRPVTSALHEAVCHGHGVAVFALLDAGASPIVRNLDGDTPLDLAARGSHVGILRSLLMQVNPVDRRRFDGACAMALFQAAKTGARASVKYLQKSGVPVNAFAAMALGNFDRISRNGVDTGDPLTLRHPTYRELLADGALPLHYAAAQRDVEAVADLLNRGVDPDAKTLTGFSALVVAAVADTLRGRSLSADQRILQVIRSYVQTHEDAAFDEVLERLESEAEEWPGEDAVDDRGVTALLLRRSPAMDPATAVALGELSLLDQACQRVTAADDLVPALCLACWLARDNAVELLLRRGVPAGAVLPGRPGCTALRLNAQGPTKGPATARFRRFWGNVFNTPRTPRTSNLGGRRVKIAQMLLALGAQDPGGAALTDAIKGGNRGVAMAMLRHKDYAPRDARDPYGQATATAIVLSDIAMLVTLLEHGADPNRPVTDLGGMQPLHVALAWHGPTAAPYVERLLQSGADPARADGLHGYNGMEWARYGCWPKEVPAALVAMLGA